MMTTRNGARSTFHLVLIKPSHYDDDGYVIQWVRSLIPSNSLATLYGLASDCVHRHILGPDVELKLTAYDETNTRIDVRRIVREVTRSGSRGVIGLVGVQSNQFPRAMDLGRQFRAAGVPVCIGGFHVSGCLAMLPELPAELRDALDLGISLFGGEAEGRLETVLLDAYHGQLHPVYDFTESLPPLGSVPVPFLPADLVRRTATKETSFDAGRGCPFLCSFCTIINVQGRTSRHRSADDVERIVRTNFEHGIHHYFITDDNFARNREWEAILDRLIRLRELERIPLRIIIQVDTMCHRLPRFVEKAARAGVNKVFIGLESLDSLALIASGKRQNRVTEYRRLLQAWHDEGVVTCAGYILGFPDDTPDAIIRNIEVIKRELPVDILEFFFLTPLPGSEDHARLHREGAAMDPDLNKYDLNHVTTAHPTMSTREWEDVYRRAWRTYYTPEHIRTLLRRARVLGIPLRRIAYTATQFYACHTLEHVHPLDGGFFRRKHRRDRRPGLSRESPLVFYPRLGWEWASKMAQYLVILSRQRRWRREVERDPRGNAYTDDALSPVPHHESSMLVAELLVGSDVFTDRVEHRDMKARMVGAAK